MPGPSKDRQLSEADIRYLRDGGAGLGWIAGSCVLLVAAAAIVYGFLNGNTDMSASRNPANLSVPTAASSRATPVAAPVTDGRG